MVKILLPAALGFAAVANTNAESLRRTEAMHPGGFSCYVEHGFDYVGNDITNVRAPLDQCCNECEKVENCGAWTWTDFNGGTCWLKTNRGDVVVNAYAHSALFYQGGEPQTCSPADDIDFDGFDIGNYPSRTSEKCCDLCTAKQGCRAYTWSDWNGGTCWFKSDVGRLFRNPGLKSAEVYPSDGYDWDQCVLERNVDFVGNDIANEPAKEAADCCRACEKNERCGAFTWTDFNGGTCWLKSGKGDTVAKPGAVSSATKGDRSCPLENGIDIVGADVGNVPGKEPKDCCHPCRAHDKCRAFTWSNFNGGTCWFKDGSLRTKNNDGTVTGYARTWL
ncbi:hypothetical protein PINS_up000889 [Pythium insidiosum]|nr:hypothetical protein PINS_up000888 [Pythium insidiosum]GLD92356.1 hypothetical protein PINS_up000889 [Pythium insidiosum]